METYYVLPHQFNFFYHVLILGVKSTLKLVCLCFQDCVIEIRLDMAWVKFNTALKEVCQKIILTQSSTTWSPLRSVIWWLDMRVTVVFSKWPLPSTLAVDFKLKNHIIISSITTVCDCFTTSGACTVVLLQA